MNLGCFNCSKYFGSMWTSKCGNKVFGKFMTEDINKCNRDNWVKANLRNIPAGLTILDAGAGMLYYKKYCSHLNYISQDFGEYDGKGDKRSLSAKRKWKARWDIKSDIAKIPLPNNSVDIVLCTEVFEHLPNPIDAIKEFSRLIKINGKLILTAPVCSLTHMSPFFYYNGFSRYYYEKYLPENGFKIESMQYNGNWFLYLYQELNRFNFMAKKYTKTNPISRFIITIICRLLAIACYVIGKSDKGSKEILSFGIHIYARKI